MRLGFASDHKGYPLKEELINHYNEKYEVIDYGTNSEESVDYPDYAFKLGEAIIDKDVDFGIAICASGIGISIACNKVKGIRCAKVNSVDEAEWTRLDNNSQIVALGAKTISKKEAIKIIDKFIQTDFSNEERHQKRIDKITGYEEGTYAG